MPHSKVLAASELKQKRRRQAKREKADKEAKVRKAVAQETQERAFSGTDEDVGDEHAAKGADEAATRAAVGSAAAGGSGGACGGAGVASVWEAELSILARQAEGDPCDLLREMLRGSVADSALKSKLPRGRGEAGAISGLFPVLGHTLTIRASALEPPFDGTKLQLSSSCPQALALALNSVLRRVLVQGEASKGGREAAGACMVEQLSAAVRGLELAALEASDNAFSARRLRERQLQGGVVASRAARAALALAEEAEALLKRARAVVTSMPM